MRARRSGAAPASEVLAAAWAARGMVWVRPGAPGPGRRPRGGRRGSPAPALPQPRRRSSGAEEPGDPILLPLALRWHKSCLLLGPPRRPGGALRPLPIPAALSLPGPGVPGPRRCGRQLRDARGPAGPAPGARRGHCPFCPFSPPPFLFFAEIISAPLRTLIINAFSLLYSPPPFPPWPLSPPQPRQRDGCSGWDVAGEEDKPEKGSGEGKGEILLSSLG